MVTCKKPFNFNWIYFLDVSLYLSIFHLSGKSLPHIVIHIKSYSYFFIILFHDSFKIKFIWTICLANLSRRQADDRPRNLSTYTFYKLKEWYIIIRSWGLVYHYFQIISRIKILCFSSFYFKKFLLNELCTTQRLFMER